MKKKTLFETNETYSASIQRRQKILLVVHLLSIFVFFFHNITDIIYEHYTQIPFRIAILCSVLFSFFVFYKKDKYELASYFLLILLGIAAIGVIIVGKFDYFTPTFIIPFILGTFSLFSWKKGLLFSTFFFLALTSVGYLFRQYIMESLFLNDPLTFFNFLFVLLIVIVFAIYYETTRIDAYKKLIYANEKKDLLYNEIHHRVKNNLNLISSMLAIQAENKDETIQNILKISKHRIDALAMVHSMLYISNDMEKVDAKRFIEKLTFNLQRTVDTQNVTTRLFLRDVELSLNEIVPIGLIINELLTNSFKHAFKKIKYPKITIVLHERKGHLILTYCDNGSGYNAQATEGLGLKLVSLNIKQLNAHLKKYLHNGLCYQINYKRTLHV